MLPFLLMQEGYDIALRQIPNQLSRGMSFNELQPSLSSSNVTKAENKEQLRSRMLYSYKRRHNVEKWLHKGSRGLKTSTCWPSSALMDLVEKSMGGDDMVLKQNYHIGNYEIVVSFLLIQTL